MRIDGPTGSQSSLGLTPPNANRVNGSEPGAADASPAADVTFAPASDFAPALNALARIPLVREEVVGEVARRLSGGELNTPQARQQTVESILGPAPGHD